MYRLRFNKITLDMIDSTKAKLGIEISTYQDAIYEICEIAVKKHKKDTSNLETIKTIPEQVFKFLQEKCNEQNYIDTDFFRELLRLYESITKE